MKGADAGADLVTQHDAEEPAQTCLDPLRRDGYLMQLHAQRAQLRAVQTTHGSRGCVEGDALRRIV